VGGGAAETGKTQSQKTVTRPEKIKFLRPVTEHLERSAIDNCPLRHGNTLVVAEKQ
jgi:hypothetical protein